MEGVKFIESIRLENILSYGPGNEPFPLEPLNVLIGPNGSGKSNLIEVLSLLAATPNDLLEAIREGGGVDNWLWKGKRDGVDATIEVSLRILRRRLNYRLSFGKAIHRLDVRHESVEPVKSSNTGIKQPEFYYRFQSGQAEITAKGEDAPRQLSKQEIERDRSILSQVRDRSTYPELWGIGNTFERIRLYREWDVSRTGPARLPQQPDEYQAHLLKDSSNLALVLSDLLNQPPVKEQIIDRMRDFYPSFRDINTTVTGGTVQIFFHEEGLYHPIPATRLSDGSIRYLGLLAILCNPRQQGVLCIEEPELGLHPDIIPELAKLLIEASARSQVFVTTHSDVLVDALSDVPESVVVCEKPEAASQLRRLSAVELKPWLENYRLGDLWTRGEIGGTRW